MHVEVMHPVCEMVCAMVLGNVQAKDDVDDRRDWGSTNTMARLMLLAPLL